MRRLLIAAALLTVVVTAHAGEDRKGEPDKPPPSAKPPAGYPVATPASPASRNPPPAAVNGSTALKALPLPSTPTPASRAKYDPGCTADLPHRCSDGRCREKCL